MARATLVLVCVLVAMDAAYAVCFDPKTAMSGYKLPLDTEIGLTREIVIGQVERVQSLQENSADPEEITAYLYTVKVLRQVKGGLPRTLTLRTENDSGRYAMDVEKEYLLFLHKEGKYLKVNSCGNSSPLPAGNSVLRDVEHALATAPNTP